MTSMELLELLGSIRDNYVMEAGEEATPTRTLSLKRVFLIAAVIALSLVLVGCTVAYVNGWFTDFFAARSEGPLSSEQIEFIQENEQIIAETQTKGEWTIELKSAICDGETAYVIFGVTAPEDIDLEGANITTYTDSDDIIPGNSPSMVMDMDARDIFRSSLGAQVREMNFYYGDGSRWQADNDGLPNTLDYVFTIGVDKLDPSKEILLDDPFASDIEFYFCFENFIHTWEDADKRAEIDAKYAGQDYMIDGEEMEGLYKSEILVEETWEFTVTFDSASQSEPIELITGEPVMTWGLVTWKLTDDPIFYEIGSGIAAVKIVSFKLSSFGATVQYEFEEPAYAASIEYQQHHGYTARHVYVVMKDGSQIALHTDGTGDKLTAETPIVLSKVDHILLGDTDYIQRGEGVIIPVDTTEQSSGNQNSVELITGEPVVAWGSVLFRIPDDNPMGYDISDELAEVKIKSFILNPFGATLTYEYFEETHQSVLIEYETYNGFSGDSYATRYVYAVMKDGSQIALHTDGTGDKLTAETPIVLSEVDHILLGDTDSIQRSEGVIIPMP